MGGPRSTPRQVVLVTGALGYIGSHTIVELLLSGLQIDILALDNLSNSSIDVLDQINHAIAAQSEPQTSQSSSRWRFVEADITDETTMRDLFSQSFCQGRPITAVIHFAALKSVSESIQQPLKYYRENVAGLTMLASIMQDWNCKQLIFSSSATVYGSMSGSSRCTETLCRHTAGHDDDVEGIQGNIGLSNPYGRTKWMCEAILQDVCAADAEFKAIALRYFNPVGAHSSGYLRESPKGAPTNLVPSITRAMESNTTVQIFGTDYKTSDGSAVRDFIHVVDLAQGHVSALRKLFHDTVERSKNNNLGGYPWYRTNPTFATASRRTNSSSSDDTISTYSSSDERDLPETPPTPSSDLFGSVEVDREKAKLNELEIFNLGTGTGSSVKEVLAAMREASGEPIPAVEVERRQGDIAISVADPSKANERLGWFAQRTMTDACRDVCRSMVKSP